MKLKDIPPGHTVKTTRSDVLKPLRELAAILGTGAVASAVFVDHDWLTLGMLLPLAWVALIYIGAWTFFYFHARDRLREEVSILCGPPVGGEGDCTPEGDRA